MKPGFYGYGVVGDSTKVVYVYPHNRIWPFHLTMTKYIEYHKILYI